MGKGVAGGGAFCYPSPADTAAAQLGAGMGVQFGEWGPWANDASGTPRLSPNKDQRPGKGEEGPPIFLILGSRGLLLSLFGEGLRLPYILYPAAPL